MTSQCSASNPKIGELAGARQRPAERSGAGLSGAAGQAADSRVTLYPRASSWRTWLRILRLLLIRVS